MSFSRPKGEVEEKMVWRGVGSFLGSECFVFIFIWCRCSTTLRSCQPLHTYSKPPIRERGSTGVERSLLGTKKQQLGAGEKQAWWTEGKGTTANSHDLDQHRAPVQPGSADKVSRQAGRRGERNVRCPAALNHASSQWW